MIKFVGIYLRTNLMVSGEIVVLIYYLFKRKLETHSSYKVYCSGLATYMHEMGSQAYINSCLK